MSIVPPTFSELVNGADYIVRATVKSVTSGWKETQGQRHIVTHVELEVRDVIAGTPPSPLILEMLGGQIGDQLMVVEGAPQFKVGEEGIFFVRGNGRQFFPLVAVSHGHYPILKDAAGLEYVARDNLVPLMSVDEVAKPLKGIATSSGQAHASSAGALNPSDFMRQIRNARVSSPTQNHAN
jgi:hypothetical protein